MTRSYKHTPCCHLAGHDGWLKAVYNRKVRRNPIDFAEGVSAIQDGMAYKRANESWDISDLKCVHITLEDYRCDAPCSKAREGKLTCRSCYAQHYVRK